MSVKTFSFVLLACLAAVQGAKLSNLHNTELLVPVEKEGRILEVPTLGDVIYTIFRVTWFLVTTAWSLIGYKLAAITLVADVTIWIARNCLSAILGAALMLAFCKLTGTCSADYAQEYDVPNELAVAAKHLADGTAKFTS